MANYTMHHLNVGSNTYEIVDSVSRENVSVALAAYPTDTASGTVATFSDGADGVPVKSLSVAVEAVQSGSGDPAPDNVRAISGWDSVKVARCGKNLFDGTLEVGGLAWATGAEITSSTSRRTGFIPVKPSTSYYEKMLHTSGSGYVIYDANKTRVASRASTPTAPFTTPATAAYIRIVLTSVSSDSDLRFSLVESDTETDYIEYVGQTYDIDLPQTVYGGTLDVSTGELTVDRAIYTFTGSENWASWNGIYYSSGKLPGGVDNGETINCYADKTVAKSRATLTTEKTSGVACNGTSIYIGTTEHASIADYTGMKLVYKLASSAQTTLTLTPEQVTTLLGQNNIYADSGSVSVTYRADTGLYIQKVINA